MLMNSIKLFLHWKEKIYKKFIKFYLKVISAGLVKCGSLNSGCATSSCGKGSSAPANDKKTEAPKKEEKKEEKVEEEEVDMGAGGLFGDDDFWVD